MSSDPDIEQIIERAMPTLPIGLVGGFVDAALKSATGDSGIGFLGSVGLAGYLGYTRDNLEGLTYGIVGAVSGYVVGAIGTGIILNVMSR